MNPKISNFGNTTITTTKSVLFFGKDVIFISLTLLPLIIGFVIFFSSSTFILQNGHVVLSEVEYYMRCEINIVGKNLIPFFNMTRYILTNSICWTNSLGLLRSLFSDNFLYGQTALCIEEGESVLDVLKKAGDVVTIFFISASQWIASNPFINTFPVYTIIEPLVPIADTLRALLTCLCGLLDPLWKIIINRIKDNSLFCFTHQIINGALNIIQLFLTTLVNVVLEIITSLFSGTILETLTYVWNLQTTFYPQITTYLDKISAGLHYLGEYITNIFVDVVCVIVSEAEQSLNGFIAVENRYASCLASSNQINIGCLIGRILNVFLKLIQIIIQLLAGIFKFLQPNDDFRWNIWNPNILWDSVRDPLILNPYEYISDVWIDRDSISTITIFNYSQNTSSCKDIVPIKDDIPICSECNKVTNTSLETCLCDIMTKIDDLILPATNRRILGPILCKGLMGSLRVIISVLKFAVDLLRTIEITSRPKIIDFLANVNTYDRVLNEIGGDINNIGGLIYFLNNLVVELVPNHPDLECIPSLITYLFKAILESVRFVLHIFQNFMADLRIILFSELNPFPDSSFLATYICVYPYGGQRCFNAENIFKWLRLPRNSSIYFKNEVNFATVNTSLGNYKQGFLECACYVINLKFISSFSDDLPFLDGFDLPDICCPFYNLARVIVETLQFLFNLVISFFQTIFEASKPTPLSRIFILRYLSCLSNNSIDPCSNINAILNDATDTLACLCNFITELIAIPEISSVITTDPLICLCDFFTGIVVTISNTLISVRDGAETIIGIFDCINATSGAFEQSDRCQIILPLNTINIFNTLNLVVDAVGTILSKFACLLSNLFAYKCLNVPSQPLCLSIDFTGCVTRRGCESYATLSIIGNNIPSEDEILNCEFQCGEDPCSYCLTAINISLQLYNDSVVGCPNGCIDPKSCTPNDKFAPIINSVYLLLGNIIKLVLSWIEQVLVFIIQQSTGNNLAPNANIPSTLTEFLDQFLEVVGTTLFGDTIHTWGPLQHFGDFLNCVIGPPGCEGGFSLPPIDINSFFPTQDQSTKCFGSVFILTGNILGQLYNDIKTVLISFIGFVEAILTGQDIDLIGTYIKNFILGIFQLIANFIKNLALVAQFLFGLVAGVFNLIFPNSYDTIFTVLNTVAKPFLFVLQSIFNFLKDIGVVKEKKRFLGFDDQIYDAYVQGLFEKWNEFHKKTDDADNYSDDGRTQAYNLKDIIKKYKNYYKKHYSSDLEKTVFENDKKKRYYSQSNDNITVHFQQEHNLTDDEMVIISNPDLLLPLVTNDTYCYKVIKNLKDTSYQNMNLFEELAFKTCYASILVPIINNNNKNPGLLLPFDIFYNLDTFISSISDIGSLVNLKNMWDSPIFHNHFLMYVSETNSFSSEQSYEKKKRHLANEFDNVNNSFHIDNTTIYDGFLSYISEKTKNSKQQEFLLSYLDTTNTTKGIFNNVKQLSDFFKKMSNFGLANSSFNYRYSWLPSNISIESIITELLNISEPNKLQQQKIFNFKSNNFIKLLPLFHKYKKQIYEKSFVSFRKSSFHKNKHDNLKKIYLRFKDHNSDRMYNPKKSDLHQPPLFSFLKGYIFTTLPKTFTYWNNQLNNKESSLDLKRYISINETNQKVNKENGLFFLFKNVILDRLFLVSDVLSQIIKKEINNVTSGILNISVNYTGSIETSNLNALELSNFKNRRPLIMERIFILHKRLKTLKKINIPDIPNSIHNLFNTKDSIKRRLVDIECDCNCTILDNFVQELVDISTYCYEKQFLGVSDPLNLTLATQSLFEIIEYNPNKAYNFPENIIYPFIRIDFVSTVLNFVSNLNTDITRGYVGLLYIIRRLPIPFASIPCSRINLTCQLGIGLLKGMIVSGIIVFVIGVLLYIFSPSLGGLLNTIFVTTVFGSLSLMFIGLTLNLAWGYQLNCFIPDENSLLSLAFPALTVVKMLPECAADEIYNFITNYIIVACPLEAYSAFGFQNLIANSTLDNINTIDSCPSCPQRLNFTSCYDYGLESPFTVFGMFLLRYIPSIGQFLQNSCFVRGNCFGFLVGASSHSLKNDGILGSLFSNFNSTEFIQQTNPILEQCFYFNSLSIVSGLLLSIFLTIISIYVIILTFDIANWLISLLLLFQSEDLNKGDMELSKKYYG